MDKNFGQVHLEFFQNQIASQDRPIAKIYKSRHYKYLEYNNEFGHAITQGRGINHCFQVSCFH